MTRDREGAHGRGIVGYLARVISDYTVKEREEHFRRSPVAMGEAIRKVEDWVYRDQLFATAIKRMMEELIEGKKKKITCFRYLTPTLLTTRDEQGEGE